MDETNGTDENTRDLLRDFDLDLAQLDEGGGEDAGRANDGVDQWRREQAAELATMSSYIELQRAWLNERSAPDLLPFRSDLVEDLLQRLERQKENTDQGRGESSANAFVANLYYIEIERIKYVIRSYLKTRLTKIDKYNQFILQDEELQQRLSQHELEYAQNYQRLLETHFHAIGLNQLPEQLARLDTQEMIPKPKMNSYVLCRVRNAVLGFVLKSSGILVDLDYGDLFALRYDDIAPLVLRGDLLLI